MKKFGEYITESQDYTIAEERLRLIDEAVVAHVPIPDKLLHRHAPGQSIVARQVRLIELRDGVFGVFEVNAVVDGSHTSEK